MTPPELQLLEPPSLLEPLPPRPSRLEHALRTLDVVLVHDYLNQRGGAERVALEMARAWPEAPLWTSLFRAGSTFPEFVDVDVRTTALDRLPVDRGFRALLPLYPSAFASVEPVEADVLLASTSHFAHHLRAAPGTARVVYCHTPPRWLHGGDYLGARDLRQALAAPLLSRMRELDRLAAARPGLYVANSRTVQERIRRTYGRDSLVVHPPVDVDRFHPSPRGERLLVVSRFMPYKRVDLAIRAAQRAGFGLDVVGDGPQRAELERLAGPETRLWGAVDDEVVTELMQSCCALVVAGAEDFGITAVEAQAAGKPVVAYGVGGALETVVHGRTGVLFDRPDVDSLVAALREVDGLRAAPAEIAAHARRFSREAFRTGLATAVAEARRDPGCCT